MNTYAGFTAVEIAAMEDHELEIALRNGRIRELEAENAKLKAERMFWTAECARRNQAMRQAVALLNEFPDVAGRH